LEEEEGTDWSVPEGEEEEVEEGEEEDDEDWGGDGGVRGEVRESIEL
jgi:hypothetical protein